MKVLSFVKNFLHISIVGVYFEFLLWLDKKKTETRVQNYKLPKPANKIILSAVQVQYEEGVKQIKNQVNNLVSAKTAKEYDLVLKNINDLLYVAKNEVDEVREREISALRKVLVAGSKDITSDTQKAKMIEKRILDYYELQRYNKIRELQKKIRVAERSGNLQEAEKLKKDWASLNGRHR